MRVTQLAGLLSGIVIGAALPEALAAQIQTAVGKTDSTAAPPAAEPAAPPALPLGGLKISGYAEASYAWSNKPAGTTIAGRLYDRFHD